MTIKQKISVGKIVFYFIFFVYSFYVLIISIITFQFLTVLLICFLYGFSIIFSKIKKYYITRYINNDK